jgi:hypothetical protein
MDSAEAIFSRAVRDPVGSSWHFLASITLTVFALEAYLNFRGLELSERGLLGVADYDVFERMNPKQKIDQLGKDLKVGFRGGWGGRPLTTVQRAITLRNEVAHPKVLPKSASAKPIRVRPADLDRVLAEDDRIGWKNAFRDKAFVKSMIPDVWSVMQELHDAHPPSEFNLRRGPPQLIGATLVEG